jgi:predicted outer membrane repeat protein
MKGCFGLALALVFFCSLARASILQHGNFDYPLNTDSWTDSGWTSIGPGGGSARENWEGGYSGNGRMAVARGWWDASSFAPLEIYQDVSVDYGMRLNFSVMIKREADYNEVESRISIELLDDTLTPLNDNAILDLTGLTTAAWQSYSIKKVVTNPEAAYARVRIYTRWSTPASGATTMWFDDAQLTLVPVYVSPSGAAIHPYLSWADAATTVQQAVDAAVSGDTILVTNGVYDTGGRSLPGYLTTNRLLLDKAVFVKSVNGAEVTLIEGVIGSTRCVYLGAGASIEGFTLLNGGVSSVSGSGDDNDYSGGGVFMNGGSLKDCIVKDCRADFRTESGPGHYIYRGGNGGGAFAINQAIIAGSIFQNNFAGKMGGGIYGADITISNCLIIGNSVTSAVTSTSGGGLHLKQQSGLHDSIVSGNTSVCVIAVGQRDPVAGGLYAEGASVISRTIVSDNLCGYEAGGARIAGSAIMSNCVISGNYAEYCGGGVFCNSGSSMFNCLIISNRVNQTSYGRGGGVWKETNYGGPDSVLVNCTIVFNAAYSGSGFAMSDSYSVSGLRNSISYYNVGDNWKNFSQYGYIYADYSCTYPLPTDGAGNIANDPQFLDVRTGLLKATSPCIDAGNNSHVFSDTDVDGSPRILDGIGDGNAVVDMGCSEYGISAWVTSGDQSKKLFREPRVGFCPSSTPADYNISIDESDTYQTMEGFGAAITEAAAYNLMSMPEEKRNAVFDELFTDKGLDISCIRIPLGGSDYCLPVSMGGGAYTYNDIPTGYTDPYFTQFSIQRDMNYKIPAVQEAMARKDSLTVIMAPWTAPGWMKNNESLFGGRLKDASGWTETYSEYLVRAIEAYAAQDIPVKWLSLQNEPLLTLNGLPTMRMEWWDQVNLIVWDLGSLVANRSPNTKLLIYDQNWVEPEYYPIPILNDLQNYYPAHYAALEGTAFHAYEGTPEKQTVVHNAHPTKSIFFTEATGWHFENEGQDDWFSDDLAWEAENLLIGAVRNYSKTLFFWNVALDEDGGPHLPGAGGELDNPPSRCRGMITVNSLDHSVKRHVEYYVLGHLSKFVLVGSQRIVSDSFEDVQSVAFLNPDGTRVLILLNKHTESKTVRVNSGSNYYICSVPAKSVATLKW